MQGFTIAAAAPPTTVVVAAAVAAAVVVIAVVAAAVALSTIKSHLLLAYIRIIRIIVIYQIHITCIKLCQ